MNHHFQFLLSVCPFPFLCCLEKVPARNHNTLRSCRFAKVSSKPHLLWKHFGRCYMSVKVSQNYGRPPNSLVSNKTHQHMSARKGGKTVSWLQTWDMANHLFLLNEKNRLNIAKLVRSRPSELRSTNSTEYQIKFFCKFKFRKHRENLKEIKQISFHIMMRYEEKNWFKDRLTRLKRLVDRRSHWMPLVVNRVRGGVPRSLVLCSFKSDCVSVTKNVQL